MTTREFAKYCGMSQQSVVNILNSGSVPKCYYKQDATRHYDIRPEAKEYFINRKRVTGFDERIPPGYICRTDFLRENKISWSKLETAIQHGEIPAGSMVKISGRYYIDPAVARYITDKRGVSVTIGDIPDKEEFITVEVARICHVRWQTVTTWVTSGKIPERYTFIRREGKYVRRRYFTRDVFEYIQENVKTQPYKPNTYKDRSPRIELSGCYLTYQQHLRRLEIREKLGFSVIEERSTLETLADAKTVKTLEEKK